MNFAKSMFCLLALLEMYHLDAKNVIGPQVCHLDTFERYDSNEPQKLKERYMSDNGNDSMSILKYRSGMISFLIGKRNAEHICRCFAKVYYARENHSAVDAVSPEKERKSSVMDSVSESSSVVENNAMGNEPVYTIDDKTTVTASFDYAYCRKSSYTKWYQHVCFGLPVIKCSIGTDRVFYVAESEKVLFGRGLRNVYLFELDHKQGMNLLYVRQDYHVINYPAGDFKLVAKAVNLSQFQRYL